MDTMTIYVTNLFVKVVLQGGEMGLGEGSARVLCESRLFRGLSVGMSSIFLVLSTGACRTSCIDPGIRGLLKVAMRRVHGSVYILKGLRPKSIRSPRGGCLRRVRIRRRRR